jgi:hypothetical protein
MKAASIGFFAYTEGGARPPDTVHPQCEINVQHQLRQCLFRRHQARQLAPGGVQFRHLGREK